MSGFSFMKRFINTVLACTKAVLLCVHQVMLVLPSTGAETTTGVGDGVGSAAVAAAGAAVAAAPPGAAVATAPPGAGAAVEPVEAAGAPLLPHAASGSAAINIRRLSRSQRTRGR